MTSKVAIITARGGSKRIPKKNIRPFLGKPIIGYSIEAAINSQLFDRIIVSTDCDEIEAMAIKFGAEVPFKRSAENSDDLASTTDVILEVVNRLSKSGSEFDIGCCLYPTAPFVTPKLLKDTLSILDASPMTSLFPVTEFSFPIQRAFELDNHTGLIKPHNEEDFYKRSQDLTKSYHDCGMFYWFKIKEFLKTKALLTKQTIGFPISPNHCHDIDTEDDWSLAEGKFQHFSKTSYE